MTIFKKDQNPKAIHQGEEQENSPNTHQITISKGLRQRKVHEGNPKKKQKVERIPKTIEKRTNYEQKND
ncbi:hypothetical protein ND861_08805 [Leptospira sp. 2 VSF19]|uniref:Uncharacterized protein n=1 Tax=Leptospira soteropolitanensis TaxID=2950025 RepID=A0AAW5VGC7_9LEPT|nr:hypothetical protein [Leptospira soteropolitanensis]MCW7492699.1 hypothetical protein [Leptospira soteropolitanensis]MCW7500382.1 hypothetical protein [Leptospira soteropolitanensis]MCW7522583.1 hypothetical protein [Leptospira soteropolitanensis]MCW7526439.1 hypothetical protein [Leptospira soteropolitanensis]MCW7530352.1 hypothetical protein [Leptospira soteropolitanensis]